MWKATNMDLLIRVELMRKEKDKKEEQHVAEIAEVIVEMKGSTIVVFWEAKIKLAEDVANARSWNGADWHEALAKLTSESVNTSRDPVGQLKVRGEVEETKNVPRDNIQAVV